MQIFGFVAFIEGQFLPTLSKTITMTIYIKYKKRLLLRCLHHLKSDLINNMDDMHISGTEASLVILSQRK